MSHAAAPMSLAGSHLTDARHVCAFFHSRDDEYRVTLPFVKDGLERGDKALHIVDPARRADHLRRLASAGIEAAAAREAGRLELHDWDDTFLRGGTFDPDEQLALLRAMLESGRVEGAPLSRYVAHAEWALERGASTDLLLEFEARVNHLWPLYRDAVICTYDLARFSADVIVNAMRTHPMVIVGGTLHRNPFYVPPDEFLRELRDRRAG